MKKIINSKREDNIIIDKRQARRNRYHIKRFFNLYLSQMIDMEKDFKKGVLNYSKKVLKNYCDLKDPKYKPFKKFGWGKAHNVFKDSHFKKIKKSAKTFTKTNVHYRT